MCEVPMCRPKLQRFVVVSGLEVLEVGWAQWLGITGRKTSHRRVGIGQKTVSGLVRENALSFSVRVLLVMIDWNSCATLYAVCISGLGVGA